MSKRNDKEKIYNSKFWFSVFGLIIGGVILILFSNIIHEGFWKTSVSNLASAVLVAGIFAGINEKYTKDSLVEMILNKMNLKQDIDRTGIEKVITNIADIDYRYYLKSAKRKIDIVHVYGRTWTTNNIDELKERVLNSNCEVRVILVSPESPFMKGLAEFYNMTEDELKDKMLEVRRLWQDVAREKAKRKNKRTQSVIRLYYHKGQPASSLYRIDDRIINVQNKFSGGRSKDLPTIICKDTSRSDDLYGTFLNEINNLVEISQEWNLEV